MYHDRKVLIIDSLRGLSCLGILLYHVRVDLWIGWWRIRSFPEEYSSFAKSVAWLSVPTPFLGYAILLFFLISGFCIHFPNTSSNSQPNWKKYFKRRFWRIYPTYIFALILSALISYICHHFFGDTNWDPEKILRVSTLTQNYPPNKGQFLSNPSLWTIPLEVEFYVLYPVAFCLFSKLRSYPLALVSFVLYGTSIYLNYQGFTWFTYTFLFFWPIWLCGAWVAQLYRDKKIYLIPRFALLLGGTTSLALVVVGHFNNWNPLIEYFVWAWFYIFVFVICLRDQNWLVNSPARKVFQGLAMLGRVSFSLYLVHFPLLKLFGYLHLHWFDLKPANFLVSISYLIPVCFLAWVFYSCVEKPIHMWSRRRFQ